MHAVTLAAYLASGTLTAEAARLIPVVPAMLLPALIGARLYRRTGEAAFRRILLGLLAATGAVLIATAMP